MRNVIAHHSRVFGRNILKRPASPQNPRNQWLQNSPTPVQGKKPFSVISTMIYLCNSINPNNEIKNNLLALFRNNPRIPIYKLGFLNDWEQDSFWQ